MNFLKSFIIIFSFSFISNFLFAKTITNSIKIANAENKITTLSIDDLKAMPQTTLNIEGEDGIPHNYSGVEIQMLLNKASVSFSKDVHLKTIDSYMLIKAADNYSVIYALTEIDTNFSNKKMILAIMKDGKPLPDNFGPLQIIATGEKRHARLIRQVMEIDIRKVD